jgi:phosphoglycolate phosphatase-like HAD superfamily hydrolase
MITTILFDFDGVVLDSVPLKEKGFQLLFQDFSSDKVELLLNYHKDNGGISRFKKIRWFYEEVLNEKISEERVNELAEKFSNIVRPLLFNKNLLFEDTVSFIEGHYKKYEMHVVSGAEERELRDLCDFLEISKYFVTITGSPTPKEKLIEKLQQKFKFKLENLCLIGDSFNDFEAAQNSNIVFFAYNNLTLQGIGRAYVKGFRSFAVYLRFCDECLLSKKGCVGPLA